jgi:hypothetical protein
MANKKEAKPGNPLLGKNIPAPPAETPPRRPETEGGGTLSQYGNTVENGNTLMTQNSTLPQTGTTALEQEGTPQGKKAKITLYPTPEQTNRLYDLMEAYRKRTGVRINQQDVLRRLIEVATIDMLMPS